MPPRQDLNRLALLLGPGAVAVYLAFRAGGAAGGLAALVALGCLAALLLRARSGSLDARVAESGTAAFVVALPALLTLYFAFNAGGFFPETPAFVAIVLTIILVVRVTTADDPFAGFSWTLALAACALALYSLWILISGAWSDAPSRALIEFDRALVYLLALVLFGSLPRRSDTLRWMVRLLALAIVGVLAAGFVTRTFPDVFDVQPAVSIDRLGFPLTYWNGVGILGALGAILCLHLSSSLREPLAIRVTAAAAMPMLGATVLLTFSRGAILAGFVGLAAYALIGRPRGLLSGLIAAVPLGTLAVMAAYDATHLASKHPTSSAAAAEGHDLALTVAACCAGAALLRLVLVRLDAGLVKFELVPEVRRGLWGGAALLALIAVIAFGVPGRIGDQYDRFVETTNIKAEDTRGRLTDPANTGRIDHWNVALDGFHEASLHGKGAGTYGLYWMEHRPASNPLVVDDAHSLYVEALEELGVLGFILIVTALGAMLWAFAPLNRGTNRSLYAALAAAGLTWAIHAGIDWDWEQPAVTIWLFCLAGAALAVREREGSPTRPPSSGSRVLIGALLLAGAVAPALVLVSQRQIDDAAAAFDRGDCAEAADRATASIRTLEIRPEPYEVLGLCDVRQGFDRLGVAALEEAVERDPDNWEFRYALAVVRGSAGLDPRPAAAAALRLNPQDELTKSLVRYVDTSDRARWIAKTRPIAENERLSVVH